MALYRYQQFIKHAAENDEFDTLYHPGNRTAWSGIYRCENCGHEIVHTHEKSLPPETHHVHPIGKGPIRWRLVVTDHTPR